MPRLLTRPTVVTVPEKECAKVFALIHLAAARRKLIDARTYLIGTDAGRNFDGMIAALESRIDRIRKHGLGPIDDAAIVNLGEPVAVPVGADEPAIVEGYHMVPE